MYDKPGHLGVIQVAGAPSAAAVKAQLFPRYAGFDSELSFSAPEAFSRIEKVRPAAEAPDIEAPTDLRDALAGVPAMAPGMSSSSVSRPASRAPPAPERKAGPAGWLVVTRKNGRDRLEHRTGRRPLDRPNSSAAPTKPSPRARPRVSPTRQPIQPRSPKRKAVSAAVSSAYL